MEQQTIEQNKINRQIEAEKGDRLVCVSMSVRANIKKHIHLIHLSTQPCTSSLVFCLQRHRAGRVKSGGGERKRKKNGRI